MAEQRICSVEGCGKPRRRQDYCSMHAMRLRRRGSLSIPGTPCGEPLRFFKEVVLPYEGDDCLVWPYGKHPTGYGLFQYEGKKRYVHRVACEAANGPPPSVKHEAAHTCGHGRNGCCNPRHTAWKTVSANQMDRVVHGTHQRGERHPMVKLDEASVREIKALKGKMTQRAIAKKFGVVQGTVRSIFIGNTWYWID